MPQRFGLQESSWRHYETVVDFPEGLIPVGDAICRFNPVYGQGMSVAAREASILADLLRRRAGDGLLGLPQAYLAAQLRQFAAGERRNDPHGVMRNMARQMTPGEIDAVALL